MMPAILIPDVPEFSPIAEAVSGQGGTVTRLGAHLRCATERTLVIDRAHTGMIDAVWFGCLVGGIEGRIEEFSDATLRIAAP
jgi:hypothetical protein